MQDKSVRVPQTYLFGISQYYERTLSWFDEAMDILVYGKKDGITYYDGTDRH
jgi:hypothetical protein